MITDGVELRNYLSTTPREDWKLADVGHKPLLLFVTLPERSLENFLYGYKLDAEEVHDACLDQLNLRLEEWWEMKHVE